MSDSPTTPSGFGNVTRFVCEGLSRLGHEVHVLGWQETGASKQRDGLTLHSRGHHPMGADVLLSHLYRLRPDYLITLADVWWLAFLAEPPIQHCLSMTSTQWATYFPIDGSRQDHSLPASWIDILRAADVRIAMSIYGRDLVRRHGLTCDYIPHGVDTRTFCPPADRSVSKAALGYDDRFVVLSDARNQPRKMLHRLLTIFAEMASQHPETLLHLHCDPEDPGTLDARYSYRIREDVQALGLDGNVRFTEGFTVRAGLPLDSLVRLYQAADIHLLVSQGEGFGLPTLQASACGVVPIAAAYSANVELLGEHGIAVPIAHFVKDEFGIGRAYVAIDDTVHALLELARRPDNLEKRRVRARAFAQLYDWKDVLPQWDALLRRHAADPVHVRASNAGSTHSVTLANLGGRSIVERFQPTVRVLPALDSTTGTGLHVTIAAREMHMGEVTNRVLQDARCDPGSPALCIPIVRTTTAVGGSRRALLVPLVLINGGPTSRSAAVFDHLQSIFPVLERIELGDQPIVDLLSLVARCVLALDLDDGTEAVAHDVLAGTCVKCGVPLIGRHCTSCHTELWPELAMADGDSGMHAAVVAGRNVLADVSRAMELAQRAKERWEQLAVVAAQSAPPIARI